MVVPRRAKQLSFTDYRERTGRGGPRPGAGRPRGPRPRVLHRRRERIPGSCPLHVTLRVRPGVPSLRTVAVVREFRRSLAEACERGDFRVNHYSLQGDHLHVILESDDARALANGMKSIGARLARAVNRVVGRKGRVLVDHFHLRILRTPREVRNALSYVLNNARKHLGARAPRSGSVDAASSGRWFNGWREGIVASARSPAPIARARTCLLRVGWRRHGLLDPSEVPGRRTQRPDRAPPAPTLGSWPARPPPPAGW